MYSWMFESFSAFGFFVQTPCGPRKSGMPDSVEMPAPVSATMRELASTQLRAIDGSSTGTRARYRLGAERSTLAHVASGSYRAIAAAFVAVSEPRSFS